MGLKEMAAVAKKAEEDANRDKRELAFLTNVHNTRQACLAWFKEHLSVTPELIEVRTTTTGCKGDRLNPKHFAGAGCCKGSQWKSVTGSCYVEADGIAFDWTPQQTSRGATSPPVAHLYKGGERWYDHSTGTGVRSLADLGRALKL